MFFIVDEYDEFLFDKKTAQSNYDSFSELRKLERMIGFSGSTLSELDRSIVENAFKIKEIRFP
jgi:hypothetical protein